MSQAENQIIIGRRAELLAELFLLDLGAKNIIKASTDYGVDFFALFQRADGGEKMVPFQVKGTEKTIHNRFPLSARSLNFLSRLQPPAYLLIVDVKRSKFYYANSHMMMQATGTSIFRIPVISLSLDSEIEAFTQQLVG